MRQCIGTHINPKDIFPINFPFSFSFFPSFPVILSFFHSFIISFFHSFILTFLLSFFLSFVFLFCCCRNQIQSVIKIINGRQYLISRKNNQIFSIEIEGIEDLEETEEEDEDKSKLSAASNQKSARNKIRGTNFEIVVCCFRRESNQTNRVYQFNQVDQKR